MPQIKLKNNIMNLVEKYDVFLYEKTQSKLFISIASKMNKLNIRYNNTEKKLLKFYEKNGCKNNYELEKICKELRIESDNLYNKLRFLFSEAENEFKAVNNI